MRNIKIIWSLLGVICSFQLFAFHVSEQKEVGVLDLKEPSISAFSTINSRPVVAQPDHFKFLVSGHFHGSSSSASGMPAASLLANLDSINSLNLAFTVCLGDLFLNVEKDYKNYEKFLFEKLKIPLFNAVGNHDVDNEIYKKRYGKTFESFDIGVNRFIVINTELNNGDIVGEQLTMLKNSLNDKNKKNIFIFMHRTLWAEDDDHLSELFPDNTKSATETNFQDEVMPLIRKASKGAKIYLFSGSIGGQAPASFLYHKLNNNITVVATAIRDLPRDAVLIVNIHDGKVSFTTMSLNSNKVLPLEEYTVSWWKKHKSQGKPFNWRLVPLYIYQMITHRYFWYGIGYFLFFIFSSYLFRKVRKKRAAKN